MTDRSPGAATTRRIEQQLEEAGLHVAVESSDGSLILSGVVETEEARQAAADVVASIAPDARIDDQLTVEIRLPTDVDDFVGGEPTAELAESAAEVRDELEPDFTDDPGLSDPMGAVGPHGSGPDEVSESGDVYTPAIDPVVSVGAHGETRVLGGFETDSDEAIEVEPSASDSNPGDEALADAVRRELAEDASTADLEIVVAVRNGVAHLRGRVSDLDDAENAEAVAARVPGVREVAEELEVAGL
jgi:osmotically-inducible protein OsmY